MPPHVWQGPRCFRPHALPPRMREQEHACALCISRARIRVSPPVWDTDVPCGDVTACATISAEAASSQVFLEGSFDSI